MSQGKNVVVIELCRERVQHPRQGHMSRCADNRFAPTRFIGLQASDAVG